MLLRAKKLCADLKLKAGVAEENYCRSLRKSNQKRTTSHPNNSISFAFEVKPNPGKSGTSSISCRPKKREVVQKTQVSRGVIIFVACAGPLCAYATLVAFGDKYLNLIF
jgi:hypothetical protein